MTNLAGILKAEIARVARKQIRADSQVLKASVATNRSQIAELMRRVHELERMFRRLGKVAEPAALEPKVAEAGSLRFSAKGLASQRKRLGLSADACGTLIGASGQSIYNWEAGKARPRASHLPAIAALRKMGKKEVAERLESLVANVAK